MKELSFIILANIKKLFNWKNIIMFLIIFFCVWTTYYSFELITDMTSQFTGEYENKLARWRFLIIFINLYLNLFFTYSYIYLKKNNISITNNNKQKSNLSNIIIIVLLFALFYSVLYTAFFLAFKDIKWSTHGYVFDSYKATNLSFFIFLFFNICTILFISLIENKARFRYLMLTFIIVLNIIFFIYIWELILRYNTHDYLIKFRKILIIEGILAGMLSLINAIKKYLIYKNSFEKTR